MFDPNGDLVAAYSDGGFVNPELIKEFADDLSLVSIYGDVGNIGSNCFWESIFLDLHWDRRFWESSAARVKPHVESVEGIGGRRRGSGGS